MARLTRWGNLVAGAVILALGVIAFWLLFPKPAAVSERELATRMLGDYLRSSLKPKGVLAIGNPFAKMPNRPAQIYSFENAGVKGLQIAFGKATPVISVTPQIRPEIIENPGSISIDPKSPTPLSFLIESSAFDQLIKTHPECDVVVSLIGLPLNLSSLEAWNRPGPPRFALLLPDWRIVGDAGGIEAAFHSGKLAAAIIERPDVPATGKDRFVLVQSNNIATLLRQYPRVFTP